jgi:hypothetical protein
MSSQPYHRFRPARENKFGNIPHASRIYINAKNPEIITVHVPDEQVQPLPIWETLGITENEYYEQIHVQPVPENALVLELQIDNNEPLEFSER